MAETKKLPAKTPGPNDPESPLEAIPTKRRGPMSPEEVEEVCSQAMQHAKRKMAEREADLPRITLSLLVATAAEDTMIKTSITQKAEAMRTELCGPNPTALETLLVDRIVICWLALYIAEIQFAKWTGGTFAHADYWQRRIDHLQRRYLSAIRTLATVRKLALPVLQVNIAKRQTNIAAGTVTTDT